MKLVPIPQSDIEGTAPVWFPFLEQIAERTGATEDQLAEEIFQGRVIICLAWEEEQKQAKALAGLQLEQSWAGNLVCHVIWCTGEDRSLWFDLLDQIEGYAASLGCKRVKATCREGWKKPLQAKSYRQTHIVMEKDLH